MIPPRPMSTLQIMRQLENGIIRIPDFQREPVWDANQVEMLLDSILKGYPLGSFLLWKTSDKLKERNPLNLPARPETIEKMYLLDGQQRALALYGIFKNCLRLRSGRKRVEYRAYFDLSTETFSLYKKRDIERGKVNLSEDQVPLDEAILVDTNRQSIEKSPTLVRKLMHENKEEQFKALDRLFQAFRDPIVSAIIVEGANLDGACEIFVRLNKQGTPLNVVDIMVAKTYSRSPYFNLREKLDEVNNELAPSFILRELTILESVVACLEKGVSERNILSSAKENKLRDSWDECIEALKRAIDHLQGRKIVPVSKFLPFDILLAPLTYFFFNNERPNSTQLNELEKFFWRASASQRYIEGQNSKIAEKKKSMDSIINGDVAPNFDVNFTKASIKNQELRFGSSFCKTILCLYSTLSPKDFRTGEEVPLADCFASANARQIHHIFPRKYLKTLSNEPRYNTRIKPFVNSVANVCLITTLSNQIIGSKKPSEYLAELQNPNLKSVLESHLIIGETYESLMRDDFDEFLSNRTNDICAKLREKVR